MRNWGKSHPDPEELVRYCNGELSSRNAARVARHLDSCWECRTEVEDTTAVIGRYVHYRRSSLPERIPPPPGEWKDLKRDFARIRSERQQARERQAEQGWSSFFRSRTRITAAFAATLFLASAALVYLAHTPSIRAAELIEKAVSQERRATTTDATVLRVQTRLGAFARPAKLERFGSAPYLSRGDVELYSQVELWFRSAKYNWLSPLSAVSFSAWRNQLPAKRDVVIARTRDDRQDVYEVQTSTETGDLGEATLFLRRSDLRPVRGEFHFRNGQIVDIYESSQDAAPSGPPTPRQTLGQEPPKDSNRAEPPVAAPVGPEDELRVVAMLHKLGADLGDPLNIERQENRIIVSGVGLKEERQKEIEEALRPLPSVVTAFKQTRRTPVTPETVETVIERQVAPSTLARKIEQQVGGPAAMESFSESLTNVTEALLVRSHALRQLADRFSPEIEGRFGPSDHALLDNIRSEHAESVVRQFDQIDRMLSPVLIQLGVLAGIAGESGPSTWQAAAQRNLMAVQRFDRVLSMTFSQASGISEDSNELGNALAAVRTTVVRFRTDSGVK